MRSCLSRRVVEVIVGATLGFALAAGTAHAEPPHGGSAKAPSKAASSKPKASKPSHPADGNARRAIAGGPTGDDVSLGVESPELRALRDAEKELFPPASPAPGESWPSELPLALPGDGAPSVHATGVPPAAPSAPPASDASGDLSWLAHLEMPDLPVRWDERVVRYLEFFKDDPRGRATYATLLRKSGRWREMMRRTLRKKGLPEDLVYVSMIESGFEAVARSPAGAVGLWQFMPETGKIYGLSQDRWIDQRLDPQLETGAAADFLGDLHRRFGSWELAIAAYNMGYGGLGSVVRRYNTNDFWSLARTEGSLPWETSLYVPKILAAAVVGHNLAKFGLADVTLDAPVDGDEIEVPAGTPLSLVAQAAGCTPKDVETLNPELHAARTPPPGSGEPAYPVRVPLGKGTAAAQALAKMRASEPPLDRYVVRFGETLEQVAAAHKTTTQKLVELNSIAPGEAVRGGAVLLVPKVDAPATTTTAVPAPPSSTGPKQSVVVPSDVFVYPDRKRVFYRVLVGDTLREIASVLHASVDDLRRWNDLDAAARLQEGMTLQAFVGADADLSRVVVVPEGDVRVLPVGSDEFFAAQEKDRNFKRVTVTARAGDTLESIGKKFDVPAKTMERVNRRGRAEALKAGDTVVVYVPSNVASPAPGSTAVTASNAPVPNGPLPDAPVPDLLP
jgi:membrane-bound lytic murein transglycosylase D